MQLIPHIITIAAIIVGTHLAVRSLLNEFVADPDLIYEGFGPFWKTWSKPLWACPTCMASIHGTAWHFYFGGGIEYWIPVVLALAFVNTLLNRWVS
jgi:hypothetical protein